MSMKLTLQPEKISFAVKIKSLILSFSYHGDLHLGLYFKSFATDVKTF